ncbi:MULTISPECIES: FxsA family protein [Bhargavaea]|uniref:FxsA family protein n=1 Tax=Bhargavaea changchunensis TaxID=2134037 RepID=A0ABW2NEU2_9BACL|nr:FxsA family protein [Bhargavaea sp. CC-171006]
MKWLFLLFIVVPTTELAVLLYAGSHIGVFETILLILLTAAAGSYLAKREGLRAWKDIRKQAAEGYPPGDAAMDGLFVLAGGLLLLFPGFITDVAGLFLLIPGVRKILKPVLYRQIRKKMKKGSVVIIR